MPNIQIGITSFLYKLILPTQKLLLDIRQLSEFYVFQQGSAPAHMARETQGLLARPLICWHTPDFIPSALWPPNSRELTQVDYKVWSVMQERPSGFTKGGSRTSANCIHLGSGRYWYGSQAVAHASSCLS